MSTIYTSKTLEDALVTATECNLATLVELCSLSTTSQARIKRQRSICLSMLLNCNNLVGLYDTLGKLNWTLTPTGGSRRFPRTYELLNSAKSEPENVEGALDRFLQDLLTPATKD